MKINKSQILIIGHKGANRSEPENTLKSFRKAIQLRADYIELDVQVSKDGEIVVIHDYEISKLTGHSGNVKEMTLDELKQLNIGEGEKIPTLQEVIMLAQGEIGLQIEIKVKDIGNKIVEMLREANLVESTIISSFIHNELLKVKKLEPKIKLGALLSDRISDPRDLIKVTKRIIKKNLFAVHPHFAGVDKELVDFAHNNHLKVNVWTVNERPDMERLIKLGVDGVITDDIPLAKELLGR
ncbi:MAG: glycerophosphodiester phosphodiesterase [Promethearchaeota archaeon]|jgi:glycerophosphoryl diester phosphodiesterase